MCSGRAAQARRARPSLAVTLAARRRIGGAGTLEEIADTVLFLASDEPSSCFRTILLVDGGRIVQ